MPEIIALADLLSKRIDDARRLTIAGAGHLPVLEKPDELNTAVEAFLR